MNGNDHPYHSVSVRPWTSAMSFSLPSDCYHLAQEAGILDSLRHLPPFASSCSLSCSLSSSPAPMSRRHLLSFITLTCQGEDVGTHSEERTEQALFGSPRHDSSQRREDREARGIYTGVCHLQTHFRQARSEARESYECFSVFPPLIRQLHKTVMSTVDPRAGKCRGSPHEVVATYRSDTSRHVYLQPEFVEPALWTLCDLYVLELRSSFLAQNKLRVVSLCGWFLFSFLHIHCFFDGNGRIGRLLVAFMLQSIFPGIWIPLHGDREDYLNGLEHAWVRSDVDGLSPHTSPRTYYPLHTIRYIVQCIERYFRSDVRNAIGTEGRVHIPS